jgi:hypothetical protein
MRQPYQKPSKGPNFKRTYLPNGRAVEYRSLEDQKHLTQRLFIVDWKRKELMYDTSFQGEEYHLVKNQDNTLQILRN